MSGAVPVICSPPVDCDRADRDCGGCPVCWRGEGDRTLPLKTRDLAMPWLPRSMRRVWRPMRLDESPSSSEPSPLGAGEGALKNGAWRPDSASLAFSRSLRSSVRLVMVDLACMATDEKRLQTLWRFIQPNRASGDDGAEMTRLAMQTAAEAAWYLRG